MSIKVGDTLPRMKLMAIDQEGSHEVLTEDLFRDKLVVLFAVPGAFTPTCSNKHLPGFLQNAEAFLAKGVDLICCIAVNDAFVMSAWAADQKVGGKVVMLADGSAQFTRAMGLEMDASKFGMGSRSQRYSILVDDGVAKEINVEAGGEFKVSSAEYMLAQL